MKKLQSFLVIQCISLALSGYSQDYYPISLPEKTRYHKELTLSLFVGGGILGTGCQIERQMKRYGFDDTNYNWFSKSNIVHPNQKNLPVYDFTMNLFITRKSGLSGSYGLCNNIEVVGLESIGLGNFLFLDSKLSYFSVSYLYRPNDKNRYFELGFVLLNHRMKDSSGLNNSKWDSSVLPGIDLGYIENLYTGKTFFIDFKTNLRLAPNNRIGPYTRSNMLLEKYTSEFKATNINLSTITVGIQCGIRFSKAN